MGEWTSRVMRFVWWISVVWLALAAVMIGYCIVWWLKDKDNPGRSEIGIESALILLYSFPAALGVLAAGIAPGTGLSPYRRIGGIALLLFCISIEMVLDYLSARYR